MNGVKQNWAAEICLASLMEHQDGWGRSQGRDVFRKLVDFVESCPGAVVFRVSLAGVRRTDISFASESVVELAKRYRGSKGFCLTELNDPDMAENWDAAARRASQPLMVVAGGKVQALGMEPSTGTVGAFHLTLERGSARATEYAAASGVSISNASTKFKQLWELGFLLRRESLAPSGGVEFEYFPIV